MIPVEIGVTTHRTESFEKEKNNEHLKNNLDILEKRRGDATLWIAT